jgi:phosphoribosyl 1,2-cyclic phosphate phosphodiesterase
MESNPYLMKDSFQDLRITVLGSGTSAGVPTIGCDCDVCQSTDPRDKRLRPSVFVQYNGGGVLIDTTPDFRMQALNNGLQRVDAILFTHAHADHVMGLDDIRPFNFRQKGAIPIYGSAETLGSIRRAFPYIFSSRETSTYIPKLDPRELAGPFELCGAKVEPIQLLHGHSESVGFRFGRLAYLTDHSEIPPASIEKLRDLDVLFLDALRHKPHPTHSTVERSRRTVDQLRPRRAYFTHIGHDLSHSRTEEQLPPHIRLAYDGLEVRVR